MAVSRLTEKNDVAISLASVLNLWISALVIQNEMVHCFIRYRRKRYWLIALILGVRCNKAVKKSLLRKPQKHWIHPGRKNHWWLSFKYNQVSPQDWHENFRMSRESFLVLCQQLEEHLIKRNTRFWKLYQFKNKQLWHCAIYLMRKD